MEKLVEPMEFTTLNYEDLTAATPAQIAKIQATEFDLLRWESSTAEASKWSHGFYFENPGIVEIDLSENQELMWVSIPIPSGWIGHGKIQAVLQVQQSESGIVGEILIDPKSITAPPKYAPAQLGVEFTSTNGAAVMRVQQNPSGVITKLEFEVPVAK